MALVFDTSKIRTGDFVRISYPNSNTRDVYGNITGVYGTDLNVAYRESGLQKMLIIEASDVANGALDLRRKSAGGEWIHYPDDDFLYDDGSGEGGGTYDYKMLSIRFVSVFLDVSSQISYN